MAQDGRCQLEKKDLRYAADIMRAIKAVRKEMDLRSSERLVEIDLALQIAIDTLRAVIDEN